jgi:hypothetical protein
MESTLKAIEPRGRGHRAQHEKTEVWILFVIQPMMSLIGVQRDGRHNVIKPLRGMDDYRLY